MTGPTTNTRLMYEEPPPSYESVMRTQAQQSTLINIQRDEPPTTEESSRSTGTQPLVGHGTSIITKFTGAATMMVDTVCIGLIILPYAFACTGWIGTIVLLILSFVYLNSSNFLMQCWYLSQPAHTPSYSYNERPLHDITFKAFGSSIYTSILKSLNLLFVCTVYLSVAAEVVFNLINGDVVNNQINLLARDNMDTVENMDDMDNLDDLDDMDNMDTQNSFNSAYHPCFWRVCLGCILIPCTFIGAPRRYWPSSMVLSFLCVEFTFIVMNMTILGSKTDTPPPTQFLVPGMDFINGIGIMVFCIGNSNMIPNSGYDLSFQTKYGSSYSFTFLTIIICYLGLGCFGYFVFGDSTDQYTLLTLINGDSTLYNVVEAFLVMILFFAILNNFDALCVPTEEYVFPSINMFLKKIITRTLMMAFVVLLSLLKRDYMSFLLFAGLSTILILMIIVPRVCYLNLSRQLDMGMVSGRNFLSMVIVILVSIMVCFTTWIGVSSIFLKFNASLSCFGKDENVPPV